MQGKTRLPERNWKGTDAGLETRRRVKGKKERLQVNEFPKGVVSRGSGRSCSLRSNSRFPVGEAPPSEAEAVRPKTSSPNVGETKGAL